MKNQPLTDYWQNVKIEFSTYIENKCLCTDIVRHYKKAVERLLNYAMENEIQEFSRELGINFLQSEKECNYKEKTIESRHSAIKHLERLLFGEKPRPYKKPGISKPRGKNIKSQRPYPEQFAQTVGDFFEFLRYSNYRESTIRYYNDTLLRMLWDFDEQGIKTWKEIKANNLTITFSRSPMKINFYFHIKKFFKYLVDENIISYNYSGILPKMTIKSGIPSVYSSDEINILLNSIDRTKPRGKRNYAIILMGVRLGLRASDIRLLRFDNVNFEYSIISFVQHKTRIPQKISLVEEVERALRDYINNGRVESDEPYIFLNKFGKPFGAKVIQTLIGECFRNSGIDFGIRKHGSHALRMTFASELVQENVPYEVVRTLLGHVNRGSTKQYVQLALEKLRMCALDVPAPTGLFEKYLGGGVV